MKRVNTNNLDFTSDKLLLKSIQNNLDFKDNSYNFIEFGIHVSSYKYEESVGFIIQELFFVNGKDSNFSTTDSIEFIPTVKDYPESIQYWFIQTLKYTIKHGNYFFIENIIVSMEKVKIRNPTLLLDYFVSLGKSLRKDIAVHIYNLDSIYYYKFFFENKKSISKNKEELDEFDLNFISINLITNSSKTLITMMRSIFSHKSLLVYLCKENLIMEDFNSYYEKIVDEIGNNGVTNTQLVSIKIFIEKLVDEKGFIELLYEFYSKIYKDYPEEKTLLLLIELYSDIPLLYDTSLLTEKEKILSTTKNFVHLNKVFNLTNYTKEISYIQGLNIINI